MDDGVIERRRPASTVAAPDRSLIGDAGYDRPRLPVAH
jgi:hypothetical protein